MSGQWQFIVHLEFFSCTVLCFICRKIRFFPNGKGAGLGSHLSYYLALVDPKTLPPGCKIYAEYTLHILNQTNAAKNLFAKGKINKERNPINSVQLRCLVKSINVKKTKTTILLIPCCSLWLVQCLK